MRARQYHVQGHQEHLRTPCRQPVVQFAEGFLGPDGRLFLQENRAGIDSFVHLHDRDAGPFLPFDQRPLEGRRPPVFREERGVDIDAAEAGAADDLPGKDLAEGGQDNQLRREGPEGVQKRRLPDFFRLEDGEAEAVGGGLDRRGSRHAAPPLGAVGLGDDADNRIALTDQSFQGGNGKVGRSHKEGARFGHVWFLLHEIDGVHVHLDLQAVFAGACQQLLHQLVEGAAFFAAQQELPAVPPLDPGEGGFGGADDGHLPHGETCGEFPGLRTDTGDGLFPLFLLQTGEMEPHEAGKRRVGQLPAQGQLFRVKSLVVVCLRFADDIMVRIEGLDHDPPRAIAPSPPSRHLGEDLEGPFGGAKIRLAHGGVRGDDADESDARKIVPLGDHLRADEDIDLPPIETLEKLFRFTLPGCRVAVHAGDAGRGEKPLRLFRDPFGACALTADAAAFGSRDNDRRGGA